VEGGANNGVLYDNDFLKASDASFDQSQSTAVSELYSAVSGGYGTVQDRDGNIYEPDDTLGGQNSNGFVLRKAEFPLRVNWSILPRTIIR
jgi:hypothetical protein